MGTLLGASLLLAGSVAGWTPVSVEGPVRHTYASALDSSRGRLLMFGGSDWSSYRNETDVLDLSTGVWTSLAVQGVRPSPRRLVEGVYDPLLDRFVVFGGFGDDGFHNDVWALSLSGRRRWREITPTGPAPAPRAGHAVAYDPIRHEMIVFGGYDPTSSTASRRNDVWALSLLGRPSWRRVSPAGTAPSPRSSHSLVYDGEGRRVLVFGGTTPSFQSDVWALTLDGIPAWTQIAASAATPSPREEQVAIYDAVRRQLIVSGGYDNDFFVPVVDTWALSLPDAVWTQLAPTGSQPPAAWGQGAVYDPGTDRLVAHTGFTTWGLVLSAPDP